MPGEDHASLMLRTVDSAAFTTEAAVLAAPSAAVAVASIPNRQSQDTAHQNRDEDEGKYH